MAACEFYRSLGKDPVVIKKETPSFIANRVQAAVCSGAYSLISRGVVSAEDNAVGLWWLVLTWLDKTWTWSALGIFGAYHDEYLDFRHFMDHLGPALKTWIDDMRQHQFEMTSQEKGR
jgi:3-hydroxyacyl-CoA dehydrogenase